MLFLKVVVKKVLPKTKTGVQKFIGSAKCTEKSILCHPNSYYAVSCTDSTDQIDSNIKLPKKSILFKTKSKKICGMHFFTSRV